MLEADHFVVLDSLKLGGEHFLVALAFRHMIHEKFDKALFFALTLISRPLGHLLRRSLLSDPNGFVTLFGVMVTFPTCWSVGAA